MCKYAKGENEVEAGSGLDENVIERPGVAKLGGGVYPGACGWPLEVLPCD